MYNIAIVDDDKDASERLESFILKYAQTNNVDLSINKYCDSESLLAANFLQFNVIFLDIAMSGKDGLEAAKELRARDYNSLLIFCTNLEQYAINGYEVDAIGYIIKPISEYAIFKIMDKSVAHLKLNVERRVIVKTVQGNILIPLKDIIYVEVQEHNLYYHVLKDGKDEIIRSRGSMLLVVKSLNCSWFAQCSACYLVNFKRVISIRKNMVNLDFVSLPISRNYKKDFTDKFMKYMLTNGASEIK